MLNDTDRNTQRLIHMNGRIYDYNLGRFLSVEPFIQAPTNTQSVNPYSYIMNNPLAGTDPTGYLIEIKMCPPKPTCDSPEGPDKSAESGENDGSREGKGSDKSSSESEGQRQYRPSGGLTAISFGGNGSSRTQGSQAKSSNYQQSQYIGGQSNQTNQFDIKPLSDYADAPNVERHYESFNPYVPFENLVTVQGIMSGLAEYAPHKYWRRKSGKWYPSRWGGNQYTGGRKAAIAHAKKMASRAGRGFFGIYSIVRAVDAISTIRQSTNRTDAVLEGADATLDIAAGAIGAFGVVSLGAWGGPVGLGIAGAYWLADELIFDGNITRAAYQYFRREEEYQQ